MLRTIFLLILVFSCRGDNGTKLEEDEGEGEGFGGIINGFLSSLSTSSSSSCPGRCVNSLASVFMCDKVLEDKCPNNLACCVDNDNNENVTVATVTATDDDEVEVNRTEVVKEKSCPGECVGEKFVSNCEVVVETDFCPRRFVCCVKGNNSTDSDSRDSLEESGEVEVKDKKECRGQCRNAIFGLFLCDETDNEAYCEDSSQTCCLVKPPPMQRYPYPPPSPQQYPPGHPNVHPPHQRYPPHPPQQVVPQKPQQPQQPQTTTMTTPLPEESDEIEEDLPPPGPPPQIHRHPPPPQNYMHPCGHYCIPRPAHTYCEQPYPRGICGKNGFCCGHDVQPILESSVEETTTTATPTTTTPCPGQCIRPIMSFTCFLNAEMTDIYKCADSKMKCCAPKTALPKDNATVTTPTPMQNINQKNTISLPTYPMPQVPQMPLNKIERLDRPPISRYVCGVKGTSNKRRKRVVGGNDSLPGEWCWQVALINSLNQYLCGGALIGTEWILTAAHCVTNIVRSGDAIYVRVGDHDLTSKYGSPGAQTLRVATTYIHHNHNSQTLDNDIALLKLQGQVGLKEGVCLICLPSRSNNVLLPGKRCTVTGYGYMGESGPIPLRVREAELPIVSENECIRKVNAVTEKPFVLPASSFCAGGEFKNDACQGDGGGPLVCREDNYYELTGLVSWGFGCGRQDVPGVYVKVSSFIGWINQIISIAN